MACSLFEPKAVTWVVDITRLSSDVSEVLQNVLRCAEDEHTVINLVVLFVMGGGKSELSVSTVWQKIKTLNADKPKLLSNPEIVSSVKVHIDHESQLWAAGIQRAAENFDAKRVVVSVEASTRSFFSGSLRSERLELNSCIELSQAQFLVLLVKRGKIAAQFSPTKKVPTQPRKSETSRLNRSRHQPPLAPVKIPPQRLFAAESTDSPGAYSLPKALSPLHQRPPKPMRARTFGDLTRIQESEGRGTDSPKSVSGLSHARRLTPSWSSPWRLWGSRDPSQHSSRPSGFFKDQPLVKGPRKSGRRDNLARDDPGKTHDGGSSIVVKRRTSRASCVPSSTPLELLHSLGGSPPSEEMPSPLTREPLLESGTSPITSLLTQQLQRIGSRKTSRLVPMSAPLGAALLVEEKGGEDGASEDGSQGDDSSSITDGFSQVTDESRRSQMSTPKSWRGSMYSWGSPVPRFSPPGVQETAIVTCRKFSRKDILEATEDFAEERIIGRGTLGTVFKGELHGCEVAVKKLDLPVERVQAEVTALSQIRHPNIVLPMGHCPEEGAIIYEHMSEGTLMSLLQDDPSEEMKQLKWYDRIRIASETASALLFLHCQEPPIVHGDVRPENIFVGKFMASKLGDVGVSALFNKGDQLHGPYLKSQAIRYVDPLELQTGDITTRSDVYAFGLVLLQLLLGQPNIKVIHNILAELSRDGQWSNTAVAPQLLTYMDTSGGNWPPSMARKVVEFALACLSSGRDKCKFMAEVLQPELKRLCDIIQREQQRKREESAHWLLCPISKEIMVDPVLAADGITYDRQNIIKWLSEHDTSPKTGEILAHKELIQNHAILPFVL